MLNSSATVILTTCMALALAGCGNGGGETSREEFAERMAAEHAGDAPEANPMSSPGSGPLSDGQGVTYASVEGEPVEGFLARPADWAAGGPAIIVIHEWWGLNDNVRMMARRLADAGFLALAVDLYGGAIADDPERARELMQAVDEDRALDNLSQAYAYLSGQLEAGRVGVLGWCFGGGWSLRAGLAMPDKLDAVVIYYGHLVTDPERLQVLEMPILGHFGEADQGIPVDEVRTFERALGEVDADATIYVYPGAGHAFANPSGRNYQRDAAETSWLRTLEFLDRTLKQ